jgi:hypothetical protein
VCNQRGRFQRPSTRGREVDADDDGAEGVAIIIAHDQDVGRYAANASRSQRPHPHTGLPLTECAEYQQVGVVVIQLLADANETMGDVDVEAKVGTSGSFLDKCGPALSRFLDQARLNPALHHRECCVLAYLVDRRVDDVHGMHLRAGPGGNAQRVTQCNPGTFREVQPDDDGRQALH